jgi:hypothetical protein
VVEGDYIEAPEASDVLSDILPETFGGGNPTNPFNWYSNGGINYMTVRGNMQTATVTLCTFLNPFTTGTSTLEFFDYQITTGTSTAAQIVLATSTSPFNTTTDTLLNTTANTVAASTQKSYSWNSGIGTVADAGRVGPNEYVLLSVISDVAAGSNGAGGWTYTGACQAVFRKMPGSL